MALPVISVPEFTTKIPSSGKEIKYRPFLVKEEKILLMALEGGDMGEMVNAMENLVTSCVHSSVDVKKLATFDMEHIFLRLRAKSVGEMIELNLPHKEDHQCKAKTPYKLDIESIGVKGDISDGKIMITDSVGVKMRYPSYQDVKIMGSDTSTESAFDLVAQCMEYVFDQNEVYDDVSLPEKKEWIESLNKTQFQKLTDFFENMPKVSHEITWTCSSCGSEDRIVLEGLNSFFT